MKIFIKYLLTAAVVLAAIVLVAQKYQDYLTNPWTRDGQVRAEVVQVTPRVSGPIVSLPVRDNQVVMAGDLLFAIDPRTFKASLDKAQAQFDKANDDYRAGVKGVEAAKAQVEAAKSNVLQAGSKIRELESTIEKNKAEYQRQQDMLPKKATSKKSVERAKANYEVALEKHKGAIAGLAESKASLSQAESELAKTEATLGAEGDANAAIREAKAALEEAKLNLDFTQVKAPVTGYVTNLNLRHGSNSVANQPALALVDLSSYWVDAFFKETLVGDIHEGDRAVVTLMSYPEKPIEAFVDSLGWGIAQQDGSTGFELLPNVSPTFEWIRLAQRVPVRIHLDDIPDGVLLRIGTTASVLVRTGSAGKSEGERK